MYPNSFAEVIYVSDFEKIESTKNINLSGLIEKSIERVSSRINLLELKSDIYLMSIDYKDGSQQLTKIIKK